MFSHACTLTGQGFICRHISTALCSFIYPLHEAKFYGVLSCAFNKLGCAMSVKSCGTLMYTNTVIISSIFFTDSLSILITYYFILILTTPLTVFNKLGCTISEKNCGTVMCTNTVIISSNFFTDPLSILIAHYIILILTTPFIFKTLTKKKCF
jgi:hypothetical protein